MVIMSNLSSTAKIVDIVRLDITFVCSKAVAVSSQSINPGSTEAASEACF